MKSKTAAGAKDIPVEVRKCPEEVVVQFLSRTTNKMLEGGGTSEEWKTRARADR